MRPYKRNGNYGLKLNDPRWQNKRYSILSRDGFHCVVCNYPRKLQVHHRQYHFNSILNDFFDPWEYDNDLLITLCKKCHKRGHQLYKIPIVYKKIIIL